MDMDKKVLGKLGEKIAFKYLKNKGYQILDRNYVSQFVSGPQRGEIDIVAKPQGNIFTTLLGQKRDIIHFIEVKTLINKGQSSATYFPLPEEKVDFQKQRKLIKTAKEWLIDKKISLETKWQIDIIAIRIDFKNKRAKIRYLANAVFES